jgi:hypothetical protein
MPCLSDDEYMVVFEDGMVWYIEARGADADPEYEQILLSSKETPRSTPRELSNLQAVANPSSCQSAMARVLSLLCIFLVTLVPRYTRVTYTQKIPTLANHSCSICGITHDGFLVKGVFQPIPVFAPVVFVGVSDETPKSLLVTSSIYIRPPPSA